VVRAKVLENPYGSGPGLYRSLPQKNCRKFCPQQVATACSEDTLERIYHGEDRVSRGPDAPLCALDRSVAGRDCNHKLSITIFGTSVRKGCRYARSGETSPTKEHPSELLLRLKGDDLDPPPYGLVVHVAHLVVVWGGGKKTTPFLPHPGGVFANEFTTVHYW
jgi:hypothetical protein